MVTSVEMMKTKGAHEIAETLTEMKTEKTLKMLKMLNALQAQAGCRCKRWRRGRGRARRAERAQGARRRGGGGAARGPSCSTRQVGRSTSRSSPPCRPLGMSLS